MLLEIKRYLIGNNQDMKNKVHCGSRETNSVSRQYWDFDTVIMNEFACGLLFMYISSPETVVGRANCNLYDF
jgi:hypothetical protein